jgi:glycosyltransferase involved in cell wall biosynthesis
MTVSSWRGQSPSLFCVPAPYTCQDNEELRVKILHLVGGPLNAGAALGAYGLHDALRNANVDSKIVTNSRPILDDPNVLYIARSRKEQLFNLCRAQLDKAPAWLYKNTADFSTGIAGFDFTQTKEFLEADLLHLHWINAGLVNVKHLSKVDKPIVWTMRDMWPMTGGCHYSMGCENYKERCGNCPLLERKGPHDLSSWVLKRKIKYLPAKTVIVGISNWLAERAKESSAFRNFDVRLIANNINIDDFFPVEKETARALLRIRTSKKIILLGAQSLKSPYKGFDKFAASMKMLESKDYFLAVFGRFDEQKIKSIGCEYRSFGFLHDAVSLRLVYSAADIFIAPSMMEAFGKTIAESMACGTPVVCFDSMGPKDIVDHQTNGYRARPFEAADIASGIKWILESDYVKLCNNAREKIASSFDSKIIANKYKTLYDELLRARGL